MGSLQREMSSIRALLSNLPVNQEKTETSTAENTLDNTSVTDSQSEK